MMCTEPVGMKSPTFPTDLRSGTFARSAKQTLALLCQAQAYPVPAFR